MDDWVTTSTLLSDLRDYDSESAWHRFIERFREPVTSFARSVGMSGAEADDVAQETLIAFAKAYRQGRYDQSKGRLSKWLFGIAYRQALNARRSRGRMERQVGQAFEQSEFWQTLPDEAQATQVWDAEWERSVLEQCLVRVRGEVASSSFEAFDLVVRQGLSADEAAKRLNLSRAAVYTAKHRILKRARELASEFEQIE